MQAQRLTNLLRAAVIRRVPKRNSSGHYEPQHPLTTYNDLPTPQGCWKTNYDAKQRGYNAHLLIGVASFIVTCVTFTHGGIIHWNYLPPERPVDSNDYSQ